MMIEEKMGNMKSVLFMASGFLLIMFALIFQKGSTQFTSGAMGILLLIGSLFHQFVLNEKVKRVIEFLCLCVLIFWGTILLWNE